MKKVLGIYRQFLQALKISNYRDYAENKAKTSLNYYASMLFAAFIIMLVLMLPLFFTLPNKIEKKFDSVEEFTFNINFTTSGPIVISRDNPILIINYNSIAPAEKAKVILNNDVIYTGFLFKQLTKDLKVYKDAKTNKSAVSNIIAFALLLMLPTLLLIFFFYLFIKYLVLIAIAALIAVGIAYLMKYRVSYKQMFNTAIYGISLTVLIDLAFFAFGFSFYYVQYIPFIFYMLAGITNAGRKINKRSARYIELR